MKSSEVIDTGECGLASPRVRTDEVSTSIRPTAGNLKRSSLAERRRREFVA
jgi:hypothetical protein